MNFELKNKRLKIKKFLIILFLVIFINSCDPGWNYYLVRPSLEETIGELRPEYLYKDDSLTIVLNAYDFGYETRIHLYIETPLDSIILCPQFSYIESPHFTDKTQVPGEVGINCIHKDSLLFSNYYKIKEINRSRIDYLVLLEAWEKGNIIIDELTEGRKVYRDEFSKPYCLREGDFLSVFFEYRSFANFNPRVLGYHKAEKSDFILYYDIYGNENPLIFHFAPERFEKEAK